MEFNENTTQVLFHFHSLSLSLSFFLLTSALRFSAICRFLVGLASPLVFVVVVVAAAALLLLGVFVLTVVGVCPCDSSAFSFEESCSDVTSATRIVIINDEVIWQ